MLLRRLPSTSFWRHRTFMDKVSEIFFVMLSVCYLSILGRLRRSPTSGVDLMFQRFNWG